MWTLDNFPTDLVRERHGVDIDDAWLQRVQRATVRLDGPAKLNVLDRDGWRALAARMDELSGDESLRCVIVCGTGGRAFSAGSDVSAFERQRSDVEDVRVYTSAIAAGPRNSGSCASTGHAA